MIQLSYLVRAKFVYVAKGNTAIGRIIYKPELTGWCWSPVSGEAQPQPRLTWPDVIPDVEAWYKENHS